MSDETLEVPREFLRYNVKSDLLYKKLNPINLISKDDIIKITNSRYTNLDQLLSSKDYNNQVFLEFLKVSTTRKSPWDSTYTYSTRVKHSAGKIITASPVPSPTMYRNCKEAKGYPTWNGQGCWCCILPSYNDDPEWWQDQKSSREFFLNPLKFDKDGKIITISESLLHSYPINYLDKIFFKDYDSYQNWRKNMLNLIKQENINALLKDSKDSYSKIWTDSRLSSLEKQEWDQILRNSKSGLRIPACDIPPDYNMPKNQVFHENREEIESLPIFRTLDERFLKKPETTDKKEPNFPSLGTNGETASSRLASDEKKPDFLINRNEPGDSQWYNGFFWGSK